RRPRAAPLDRRRGSRDAPRDARRIVRAKMRPCAASKGRKARARRSRVRRYRMTRPTIFLLGTCLLAAAGCRSDGGIDRKDTARGLGFASASVKRQTREDVEHTEKSVAAIPGNVKRSFREGWRGMKETYFLYLETSERPA